jgi:hypothetical protein
MEMSERAIVESLNPTKSTDNLVTEAKFREAAVLFMNGMSADTRSRYEAVEKRLTSASTTDVCWYFRETYTRLRDMEEPFRSRLARALLAQGANK